MGSLQIYISPYHRKIGPVNFPLIVQFSHVALCNMLSLTASAGQWLFRVTRFVGLSCMRFASGEPAVCLEHVACFE